MIQVEVSRNQEGEVTAIRAQGHADYAAYGEDIICAAATAVITTAMASLEDLLQVNHERILLEGDVGLKLDPKQHLAPADADRRNLVLETCVLGLKQIEFSYGNEYIKVLDTGGN